MDPDLADLLRVQHAELRGLLAQLKRQPSVTERVLEPQLRARERVLHAVERMFLAQQGARLCYLWPAVRRSSPEGRAYTERVWEHSRGVQTRMAKRQWFGERDQTAAELDEQIAWGIHKQLVLEERRLPRLEGSAGLDGTTLARQLAGRGPWPTHPHPDVPRSQRLAALMQRPLALGDRVRDLCAPRAE